MHLNLAYFGIESAVPIGNLALMICDFDCKVFYYILGTDWLSSPRKTL